MEKSSTPEVEMPTEDNIAAAMDKVAETLEPTIPANTGADEGGTATKQVLIRATEEDRERWKQAAEAQGISLSEFIRNLANAAASDILDCSHPMEMRKSYPWSERCMACGHRFL
jgi:predicted DNA binding CopG/RHH family protein